MRKKRQPNSRGLLDPVKTAPAPVVEPVVETVVETEPEVAPVVEPVIVDPKVFEDEPEVETPEAPVPTADDDDDSTESVPYNNL